MNQPASNGQFDFFNDLEFQPAPVPRPPASHPGPAELAPDPPAPRLYQTRFDPALGVLWAWIRADAPPCFTPRFVADLRAGQREVSDRIRGQAADGTTAPRYQVLGSRIPGIFSLGGDLALFRRLIDAGDRQGLLEYARATVDLVYANAVHPGLPITTISLVQGDALGGGFEAALAADFVVAERDARMGLPEVLFNLFPGMGAFQLLCRRMRPVQAQRFIERGRTATAEELYDLGLVDVLAEPGRGEETVRNWIRSHDRHCAGRLALARAIHAAEPALDYEALCRATTVWVETALGLGARDLQVIDYLLRAQQRRLDGLSTTL